MNDTPPGDGFGDFRYIGPDLPLDGFGFGFGDDDPTRQPWESANFDRHLIVYLGGTNAETFDRPDHPLADEDGHVVGATVLAMPGGRSPLTPVQARIAHGVDPAQAAAMLRKMADLLEGAPELCSGEPGEHARRKSDGLAERGRLTPDRVRAAIAAMPEAVQRRVRGMMEQLIRSIRPS